MFGVLLILAPCFLFRFSQCLSNSKPLSNMSKGLSKPRNLLSYWKETSQTHESLTQSLAMTCIILSVAAHHLIPPPSFATHVPSQYVECGKLSTNRKASSDFFNPGLGEWKAARNGLKIVSQRYRNRSKNARISDRMRIARNTFLCVLSSLIFQFNEERVLSKLECENNNTFLCYDDRDSKLSGK
jgi:hypothetical protein